MLPTPDSTRQSPAEADPADPVDGGSGAELDDPPVNGSRRRGRRAVSGSAGGGRKRRRKGDAAIDDSDGGGEASDAAAVRAAGAGLMNTPATSADGGRCVFAALHKPDEAGKGCFCVMLTVSTPTASQRVSRCQDNGEAKRTKAFVRPCRSGNVAASNSPGRTTCESPGLTVHGSKPIAAD